MQGSGFLATRCAPYSDTNHEEKVSRYRDGYMFMQAAGELCVGMCELVL